MTTAMHSHAIPSLPSGAGMPSRSPDTYWNPRLLHAFSLLMAGQGCCVNESLLLCDTHYARDVLRRACTLQDQRLQQVAVDLLASMAPATPAVVTH